MKTKIFTLLALLTMLTQANAQSSYNFSMYQEAYQSISNDTLLSPDDYAWDDPDMEFNLPFDYSFQGISFNRVYFDGFSTVLKLEGIHRWDTVMEFSLIPTDVIYRGAHFGTATSGISQVTEGLPGEQVTKIQWHNVGTYEAWSTTDDSINFQVWIYENGVIEVHYGPSGFLDFSASFEGESGPYVYLSGPIDAFLENLVPGGFHGNLYGNTANPTWYTQASTGPIPLIGFPANGTVYRFEPAWPTSISPEIPEHRIALNPNPATDVLNIDYQPQASFYSIQVLDSYGKRVIMQKAESSIQLNVQSLSPGIYFVQIKDGEYTFRKKLIKN